MEEQPGVALIAVVLAETGAIEVVLEAVVQLGDRFGQAELGGVLHGVVVRLVEVVGGSAQLLGRHPPAGLVDARLNGREQRYHRLEHLLRQVHRHAADRHRGEQQPQPQAAGTVHVVVHALALDLPGRPPLGKERPATRKGQHQRDEAIDHPGDRHDTHQPQPPVARQRQVVVELEDEGHEVLAREAAFAPVARTHRLAGHRVDVLHHWALVIRVASGRIVARHQRHQRGMAGLAGELHVPDLHARVGLLDALHQRPRRQHRTLAGGVVELRVEPFVQLVVEGQDAAGNAGEKQEDRRGQADVAVQEHENRTHRRLSVLQKAQSRRPCGAGGSSALIRSRRSR